jgi:hypothetical protein
MDYADTDSGLTIRFASWVSGAESIYSALSELGPRTGQVRFFSNATSVDSDFTAYTPGLNVPFNIASRHGSTFINGAVDGVALTEDTTPTALPDLSATDLDLAYDYMGTIESFRVWDQDLGDSGIEEASAPSLEPSLNLTFDGSGLSFTDTGWTP